MRHGAISNGGSESMMRGTAAAQFEDIDWQAFDEMLDYFVDLGVITEDERVKAPVHNAGGDEPTSENER